MWPWSEIALLKSSLRLFAGDHVLSKVMVEREEALKLGGEMRNLTMMFLDIAGFTSIADGLDPAQLGVFMGKYLEIVTESVFAHEGVIDSYNGDAVFAWWNDRDNRANALNACDCAKEIASRIETQNAAWLAMGWPNVRLKTGINSGAVMVGNYGTSKRMKFTVLGDHVNLTSGLCNLANGHYPTPIIISGNTHELLPSNYETSLLDTMRVKGKTEPVQLFSI